MKATKKETTVTTLKSINLELTPAEASIIKSLVGQARGNNDFIGKLYTTLNKFGIEDSILVRCSQDLWVDRE